MYAKFFRINRANGVGRLALTSTRFGRRLSIDPGRLMYRSCWIPRLLARDGVVLSDVLVVFTCMLAYLSGHNLFKLSVQPSPFLVQKQPAARTLAHEQVALLLRRRVTGSSAVSLNHGVIGFAIPVVAASVCKTEEGSGGHVRTVLCASTSTPGGMFWLHRTTARRHGVLVPADGVFNSPRATILVQYPVSSSSRIGSMRCRARVLSRFDTYVRVR